MFTLAPYDPIMASVLCCQCEEYKFSRIKLESETKWIFIVHEIDCNQTMSLMQVDSLKHFDAHDQLYHAIPTFSGKHGEAFVPPCLGYDIMPIMCLVTGDNTDLKYYCNVNNIIFHDFTRSVLELFIHNLWGNLQWRLCHWYPLPLLTMRMSKNRPTRLFWKPW